MKINEYQRLCEFKEEILDSMEVVRSLGLNEKKIDFIYLPGFLQFYINGQACRNYSMTDMPEKLFGHFGPRRVLTEIDEENMPTSGLLSSHAKHTWNYCIDSPENYKVLRTILQEAKCSSCSYMKQKII